MPISSVPSAGSTASEPMKALAALPGSAVAVGSAGVVGFGVGAEAVSAAIVAAAAGQCQHGEDGERARRRGRLGDSAATSRVVEST